VHCVYFGVGFCLFALCVFFIGLYAIYVCVIFGFYLVCSLVMDEVVRLGIFVDFLSYVLLVLFLMCGIRR
jgi:hypothetical protein